MKKVVISYARDELELALVLEDRLKSRGYDVWRDAEDLKGGAQWATQIDLAIQKAAAVVVIYTTFSSERPEVQREVALAQSLGKLICLQYDKDLALPAEIAELHALDFDGWEGEGGAECFYNLIKAINNKLKQAPLDHPILGMLPEPLQKQLYEPILNIPLINYINTFILSFIVLFGIMTLIGTDDDRGSTSAFGSAILGSSGLLIVRTLLSLAARQAHIKVPLIIFTEGMILTLIASALLSAGVNFASLLLDNTIDGSPYIAIVLDTISFAVGIALIALTVSFLASMMKRID